MNENNNNKTNGGIGFLGALQIAFIVLKLLGKITWRWFWVLSPLWISAIIGIIVIIIALIIFRN